MHRATLTTLAALAALTACNHDSAPTEAPEHDGQGDSSAAATPDDHDRAAKTALADGHVSRTELSLTDAELSETMVRLAALELLDVGALIVAAPSGAQNCYGPCEDDPEGQAWMQERAHQVDRFHDFVDTAERVAKETDTTASWDDAQAAVRALADLKLVEVMSIHHESPNCYVANCPGDPKRAAVLVALAKSVRKP